MDGGTPSPSAPGDTHTQEKVIVPYVRQRRPGAGPARKSTMSISQLAREHTPIAIATLLEIIGSPKAANSDRLKAALAMLAYGYGKPSQTLRLELPDDPNKPREKSPEELRAETFAQVLRDASAKAHEAMGGSAQAPAQLEAPAQGSAQVAEVLSPAEGAALDAARESAAQAAARLDATYTHMSDNFKAKAAAAIIGSAIVSDDDGE